MSHSFIIQCKRISSQATKYGKSISRAVVRPVTRALNTRRQNAKEHLWESVHRSHDTLFAARALSRYRAHHSASLTLPALPQRPAPATISAEMWDALSHPHTKNTAEPVVDVLMPITDNYDAVIPSLYKLLSAPSETPFRLVTIISQHPDHKLIDKLRRLQELDLFDLLQDNENVGLVELINFAMQRHDTRDIVLVSSNCDMPQYWLDGFTSALSSRAATTASISPWSLHGGITGYPDEAGSFSGTLNDSDALSAMCSDIFSDAPLPSLPAPLLQCCFIPREAIRISGLLPEDTNDVEKAITSWAVKASEKGFEHLWLPRVMVGVTSTKKHSPASELLISDNVQDALSEYRELLDKNRLLVEVTEKSLIVNGIPALPKIASGYLTLSPDAATPSQLRLSTQDVRLFPHLSLPIDNSLDALKAFVSLLALTHIEVHHLAGFPSRMVEYVLRLSHELQLPYHVHISDDYLICPGLLGVDKQCNPDDLESCYHSFIETHPLDSDGNPLWLWRLRSQQLVSNAAHITYSTSELRTLHQRYFTL